MICVTGAVLVFLQVGAIQRWHDGLSAVFLERTYELIRTVGKDLGVIILDRHLSLTMLTFPL